MGKKKDNTNVPAPEAAAPAAAGPMKICFERIIPDELDPTHRVRRALRQSLVDATKPMDASGIMAVARMAVVLSKKWDPKKVVKCRFLDGSPKMRKKVQALAHEWEKYENVTFKFVKSGPAEIRISFYADAGSWSAIGTDATNQTYFPLHQPTMNYGWLRDDTSDEEYRRVVLHEFGHALGCIHEHSSPNFSRLWNVQAVLDAFSGPPNFWTEEDIRSNVLQKYSPTGIAASVFDPASIMLYAFDARLFADNQGPTNSNTNLSDKDKAMINKMYPK